MGNRSRSSGKHHDVFVLSGGAARGAVQVGMMEGLLEHGIVPDALVGTSVGALNAAFLGWRNDRARIQELRAPFAAAQHPGHLSRRHDDPDGPPDPPAPLPVLPRRPDPPSRRLDPHGTARGPGHPRPHRHHATGRQQRGLPPPRRHPPVSLPRRRSRPSHALLLPAELRLPRPAHRRGIRPRRRSVERPRGEQPGDLAALAACAAALRAAEVIRRSTCCDYSLDLGAQDSPASRTSGQASRCTG